MAFRYLIYSTGTPYADTIVRESATDNPGVNEASFYSDFIIPEIQPLYLWRVTGGNTVVPNTDTNISAYLQAIAPPPQPEDDATIGYVTGLTSQKINIVTGATSQVPVFTIDGNIEDSGYSIADLTGGTEYTFIGSGGTQVIEDGNTITIYSTLPTGTTVAWGDISGSISNQTDLQNALDTKLAITDFNNYTGTTATELQGKLESSVFDSYTGTSETRFEGIEGDIDYISGVTSGLTTQIGTKLNISTFSTYTGTTETRIQGIEDDVTELFDESLINITGATNGLTKVGGKDVEFGGVLTKDTVISGLTNDFMINVDNITLQSVGAINLIDANGVGGINIESDGGVVKLQGNDGTSTPITKIEVSESTLLITDDRATPRGIQYAEDYGTTFQNRSLVDKAYVDAVATGLVPKANVKAATTVSDGNIDLTGGTFSGTIDGYTLLNGDRILITEQTLATENGIYVYTLVTNDFARSIDFDGNPDGEVTDGNLVPVLNGVTYSNTIWVLVTPNPIIVGTTPLTFTLFSSPLDLQEGVGIGITGQTIAVDGQSIAGNSISWTGNSFNVDITSGSLATALNGKLDGTIFNIYTGATETRLQDIETDINNLETDVTGLTATKLDSSIFNSYTGATDGRLDVVETDIIYLSGQTDTKLDSIIFNTYTGATTPNEIFLTHSGGTELNTIAATAIEWDVVNVSGSSFLWSGGTDVFVTQTGDYELSYNIPYNAQGAQSMTIGANVILNNSTVLNLTPSASFTTDTNAAGSLSIPTVILSLTANDKLTLATFRTGLAGSAVSSQTGSILIKKKNTLQ